ncbi:iron-sulfur cluster assembly protein [Halorarum salinum]|uniref:DUF59 domain-containing protein n=1 Tax=Halorarum salinum TaxID=2743089 RepID=A0A7D5LCW8_9EURY|nr:iron-sulfur cluster assembly protein [Halobaculum salinum]QLG63634.1 DUF59 domain-containing protein [Halobaculum salinum]
MGADARPAVTSERARRRLRRVTDPELDESIVDLGYLDEVAVDGGRVAVSFTLPTAWCSPAFAWMMATDVRDELDALRDVRDVRVNLRDHVHADEITTGVNDRRSFAETFPDAEDGVSAVRAKLDDKARLARQHEAVGALLEAGLSREQIVSLTPADLDGVGRPAADVAGAPDRSPDGDRESPDDDLACLALRDGAVHVAVEAGPLVRYLEKARETGFLADVDDPLFGTPDGEALTAERFDDVRARTRLASVNMSGQGGVCDALNEARRSKLGRKER